MSDADFYLPRHDQLALRGLLRKVPALVEDLAVTITRQDRVAPNGPRVSRGERVFPLPFNEKASEIADELHHELARWIRFVCEERGIEYWPPAFTHHYDFIGPLLPRQRRLPVPLSQYRESTMGMARWLDRYMTSLALIEGSEFALADIWQAFSKAEVMTYGPRKEAPADIAEEHIGRAAAAELHRDGIAKLAREMGPKWAGLTAKRIDTLRRREQIQAVRCLVVTKAEIFNVGDVLVAHLEHPTRKRKLEA